VDSTGNVYFSDFQEYMKLRGNIYAVSEAGKLIWKRSKTLTIKMDELKDGFINQETKTTSILTKNDSPNKTYKISDSFLGQDKMLYGIQNKKNWLLSIKNFFNRYWYFWFFGFGHVFDTNIVSMDYQGKIRWTYKIPQIDKEKRRFVKNFCDTKGNIYFVFDQAKEDEATFNNRVPVYELYSLTSTGKLRWKKEYPTKHFAGEDYGKQFDIISNKLEAENSFLVSETKIPPFGNAEDYLQCLSIDGDLLWETMMQEDGEMKVSYTMLDEKTFLVPIQDTKFDRTFLQAISAENGEVLWEKEIDSKYSTSPVIDSEGNIYIGAGGVDKKPRIICSYSSSGSLRWSMVQTNPDQAFGTNLVLGPNHTLFYGLQEMNLLYYIGEE
jgi:outer membrane protein assembly factor BamB